MLPAPFHTILLLTQCHYFFFFRFTLLPFLFFFLKIPLILKRILYEFHPVTGHRRNIKTARRIHPASMGQQIIRCNFADRTLLSWCYCLRRMSAAFVSAVFYLYKHKVSVIFCNDVDLAHTAAEIILQDLLILVFLNIHLPSFHMQSPLHACLLSPYFLPVFILFYFTFPVHQNKI